MDHTIIFQYIFGGISIEFYIAFYLFAILGMLFSMLIDFQRVKSIRKKSNKKTVFDFKYWVRNNFFRYLTNTIAIFVIIRFPKEIHLEENLNMFIAFLSGMSIDALIALIKNIKIGTK